MSIISPDENDLWYFAHPHTSYHESDKLIREKKNWQLCLTRTIWLLEQGYRVFSPILHTHHVEHHARFLVERNAEKRQEFFYALDDLMIERTDFAGLILAPYWMSSRGCVREYKKFSTAKKPIMRYESMRVGSLLEEQENIHGVID